MIDLLAHGERYAADRGLTGQLVIDADVHHVEVGEHLKPYMDAGWRGLYNVGTRPLISPAPAGGRSVAGRIRRPKLPPYDDADPPAPIRALVNDMARMGIDCSVAFPGDMLELGLHPDSRFEAAIATAYARWMTERVLPHEPRIRMLLYLPFAEPDVSLQIIERFADCPGVIGGLITGTRLQKIHRPEYDRVYAALEERGLALGVHAGTAWGGHPFRLFDRFIGVHTIHFPMFHSIHITNVVLGGLPERFPRLRFVFFEQGAAVLPMLMARLDSAYHLGRDELPHLKRLPSDYMRDFWYTVQPIEHPDVAEQLPIIFDQIGRSQVLYASDFPHWDADMPAAICDLAFLTDEDKRNILAGNAIRAFRLDVEPLLSMGPAGPGVSGSAAVVRGGGLPQA